MSFIAEYWSTDGKPLLGAVFASKSSRFHLREDAESRLSAAKEANGPHCEGKITESDLYPEILAHCIAFPSQAIGGLCFGCKKVVTVQDAKERNHKCSRCGRPQPWGIENMREGKPLCHECVDQIEHVH